MPELTHDTPEDGFHEIQLSGKQLVFVGMTVTIVFVAIFLCGVLVGRNTRPPRDGEVLETAANTTSVTVPDTAGPTATEPPAPPVEDELSYHKRLQGNKAPEELKPQPQKPPPTAAKPTPAPAAQAAPDVPTTGRPGTYFVQVSALSNRAEAAGMVKRLLAKGHPAYMELPPKGTPPLYRVRVGRYKDRREAEQVARRLKEEKLTAEVRR